MAELDGEDGDSAAEPWFYVDARGARQGPHNFRVVRAQLRCGILNASTLVWREGQAEWLACATFPVFASCCADLPGGAPRDPAPTPAAVAATPGGALRARLNEDVARATVPAAVRPSSRIPAGATATRAGSERDPPPPPPPPRDPPPSHDPAVDPEWFAVVQGGAQEGPMSTPALVRLIRDAPGGVDAGRKTWVWSADAQPEWGPADRCPALAAAIDEHRTKTSPPGTTIGTERIVPTGIPGEEKNIPGDIPGDASALRAALDDERRANASLRADVAHLEAALAAARRASSAHEAESKRLAGALERSEAKAAAYEASRAGVESAEAATARLAEAREALEAKTAELTRLRAVLRGKLLARVTEEADAARANAERLGRAEVWAK